TKGWGVPFQIQMERHLTSAMTGGTELVQQQGVLGTTEVERVYTDILTPGAVFPMTTFCQGGNAKAKRAEGFIRLKKYQHQKKRAGFLGRHYARLLTNRLNTDQAALRQSYEAIVEHELADIHAFNHSLHPDQKRYPNMTRWQVLENYQNPNLPKLQPHTVMQYIGYRTPTSIRAGKVQVQYNDYMLPDIQLIKQQHYNGEIVAYWLPNTDGDITEVYLYEDGEFLCVAQKKGQFQEAVIERTDEDKRIMHEQFAQQKGFDRMVSEGRAALPKVAVAETSAPKRRVNTPVKALNMPESDEKTGGYCPKNASKTGKNKAFDNL
ncbi:MAG: hypothetical protein EBZ77_06860, partial [Chitinophagia bacterium]|nr:hypothetical protein [Chitinophagia bacterium]